MGSLMDLVAGDARDVLLALCVDDIGAFDDRDGSSPTCRSAAASIPTWLDLFSEAVRSVTGREDPSTSSTPAGSSSSARPT